MITQRTYQQFLILLCLVCFSAPAVAQNATAIGEWRTHLPWSNPRQVVDAGDRVYCLANISFYSFDRTSGQVDRFDKTTGLSDLEVDIISYHDSLNTLIVAYASTNIDLIKGNDIVNISDIKRQQIVGIKKINSIYLADNLAYLATSFGIVVLDIENEEIRDSYFIGTNGTPLNVNAVTTDATTIYAATDNGLMTADINNPNLANFQVWSLSSIPAGTSPNAIEKLINFEGKLLALKNDTLFRLNSGTWEFYYTQALWEIVSLVVSDSTLVIGEIDTVQPFPSTSRVGLFKPDGTFSYVVDTRWRVLRDAMQTSDGKVWVADLFNGLYRTTGNNASAWPIIPEGPRTTTASDIVTKGNKIWLASGGVDVGWNKRGISAGFFSFQDGDWSQFSTENNGALNDFINVQAVATDPFSSKVYAGSFWDGLAIYDASNGSIERYNKDNSPLSGQTGDASRTTVSDVALDEQRNVWITNYGATEDHLVVLRNDDTWKSFNLQGASKNLTHVLIDSFGRKWMPVLGTGQGIVVFDEGDLDDDSDDQLKILNAGDGNGGLPNNRVTAIAQDLDGEIWVGTEEGIAVFFCPSAVFSSQGCDAQQILVQQGDFFDFLLVSERVNTIAVDGGNRKWIGTQNGLWLFSPDGTEQLLFFDEENSPLLDNNVTALGIHPNGEVFIGTENGIISYRGEATAATNEHESEVIVFPNPVRETYRGPIAIKGLAQDADVKIADINGHVVYQTRAFGGQAIWDGNNLNGDRAHTGVYMVFSSNEDGSSTNVAKLLFIK